MRSISRLLILPLLVVKPLFLAAEDEEFMLSFRHPAVESCYISAIYSDGEVYLPLGEIFSLLYIYYEQGGSGRSLKGSFPEGNAWEIRPEELIIQKGRESFAITSGDFRRGKLDFYFTPALFRRLFGLIFTVDLSRLHLSLQCEYPLPVEERRKRFELRRRLENNRTDSTGYPMLFVRDRRLASAGIVDYSLGTTLSSATRNLNYSLTGSMELLGGDLTGNLRGFHNKAGNSFHVSNLQWGWVLPENPVLTSVRVGNLPVTGLHYRKIIGCAVTNDPVMPRTTCDRHVADGTTIPGSEVELFINNQLAGFTRADALGYYRFDFPLRYGTMRIATRIYAPDGQIFTKEKQLQVPFSFLPKGVVTYHLQGGFEAGLNVPISDMNQVVHGDVAWGVARGLTAKFGADYLAPHTAPFCYTSLNARLFQQFLLSIDVAPERYYRVHGGLTLPDSKNIRFSYAKSSGSTPYHYLPAGSDFTTGIYFPLRIAGKNSGFRFQGSRRKFENNRGSADYRIDFNTRQGRMNLRFNYLEFLLRRTPGLSPVRRSLATAAADWNISRTADLPQLMKGMFVRLQTQYDVRHNKWLGFGWQVSQSLGKHCRLQLNAGYLFMGRSADLRGILTIDLPSVRSSTRFSSTAGQYGFTQTFIGSLALDGDRHCILAHNRSQAGQSAASVRLFVDANNDGTFSPGERKIPASAIRINGSATMVMGKDSVLRITRLHNYWHYQVEIVREALPDPTLAPAMTRFSFQADPNRFKPVDIPLYRTGVVEGIVFLKKGNDPPAGLGGIRLKLQCPENGFEKVLRSFTDGGFYAMNLLPGTYTLEVDPVQLGFLNASGHPGKLEFEVQSLAEGDFIEGLEIHLEVPVHDAVFEP